MVSTTSHKLRTPTKCPNCGNAYTVVHDDLLSAQDSALLEAYLDEYPYRSRCMNCNYQESLSDKLPHGESSRDGAGTSLLSVLILLLLFLILL